MVEEIIIIPLDEGSSETLGTLTRRALENGGEIPTEIKKEHLSMIAQGEVAAIGAEALAHLADSLDFPPLTEYIYGGDE